MSAAQKNAGLRAERARAPSAQKKALARHRRRLKRQGVVRLEVQVRGDDAALVRDIVRALADPGRGREARALLRERFGPGPAAGLKALLAAAPLEGIELDRARDFGRDVDF
jgi:ribosomal protein S11